MSRLDAEYVLPLRWHGTQPDSDALAELSAYLVTLAAVLDVTVVDGSEPETFAVHARSWGRHVRHLRPQPWPGRNGKVAGVVTGVRESRHERVVIADDDVRYDRAALEAVLDGLGGADLVRPQNVFVPAPWHARWDTGRSLLNRALGRDYPGTFGVRRSTFVAMGGYDGDVLFENLQLARTVQAHGGTERHLPGVYVRRVPPSTAHFLGQRVRQAYDDLAQPLRLMVELAVLPGCLALAVRRPRWLLAVLGGVVLLAEAGRRRAGGAQVFPRTAPLWAPAWLAERGICVWLAVAQRGRGGVRYAGSRVPRAASSVRALRREISHQEREPACGS